jgi:hypothetical protein
MKCHKPMLARGLNQKAACHPPSDRVHPLATKNCSSAATCRLACDLRHAERVPILCGKSTGEASGTPQKNTCNVPTEESRTRSSAHMCTRHLAPCYLLLQQVFCCRARLARQTPHRPHRRAWSRQPARLLALALRPMMRGLKAPLRMPRRR